MDYATTATDAAAAPATLAAVPHHTHYPHQYAGCPYPYGAYHQPAPTTEPSAAAAPATSSSYYYHIPATAPSASTQYDPYAAYQYCNLPSGGGAAGTGLSGYYFARETSQQVAAASTTHAAPEATGNDAGKQFGFDPQRYAQVLLLPTSRSEATLCFSAAAARASNGITQPAAVRGMHHAQWNAHFGHPVLKNFSRKQMKKKPKAVQPAPCEVCNIQCDTLEVLMIHKQGKKHKKNLEKLQDSITPKPTKPPNNDIGPSTAPAAVSNCVVPSIQLKKKKSCSAGTPEDMEVKKRRVLEAGAAQGEVKVCTVCNVVVNSQKVYEFHIAGQKHQAMVQKQQAL